MKIYIYLIITGSLLASCCRDNYIKIPEEYKSACCLYAYNENDTLHLLKNNQDTISLFVRYITNRFQKLTYSCTYVEICDIRFYNPEYSQIFWGEHISAQVNNAGEDNIYIGQDLPYGNAALPGFGVCGTLEAANYSDSINGVFYSDLYKMRSVFDPQSYIITSRSQGIIYAENDSLFYTKLH